MEARRAAGTPRFCRPAGRRGIRTEQVHDAVWDLIRWTEGRWRFRKNEKTREDVAPPMTVQDLLDNLRERGVEWEAISDVVHGPTAVPVLSARGGGAPETTLDADAWSMLCKIDGERSVAELARDCGYTLFEAGQVLVTLVKAGLVDIEEDVEVVAAAGAAGPGGGADRTAPTEGRPRRTYPQPVGGRHGDEPARGSSTRPPRTTRGRRHRRDRSVASAKWPPRPRGRGAGSSKRRRRRSPCTPARTTSRSRCRSTGFRRRWPTCSVRHRR